jgi:hypothetical protein
LIADTDACPVHARCYTQNHVAGSTSYYRPIDVRFLLFSISTFRIFTVKFRRWFPAQRTRVIRQHNFEVTAQPAMTPAVLKSILMRERGSS